MQAAAPLPSPERRPPAPANVAPVESLLSGPGRAKRPKRIAVVLRGLPGSGKSHAARRLRDTELAAGAPAPRIHSIDDYFVTVSRFLSPALQSRLSILQRGDGMREKLEHALRVGEA
jgi:hypothetical protein